MTSLVYFIFKKVAFNRPIRICIKLTNQRYLFFKIDQSEIGDLNFLLTASSPFLNLFRTQAEWQNWWLFPMTNRSAFAFSLVAANYDLGKYRASVYPLLFFAEMTCIGSARTSRCRFYLNGRLTLTLHVLSGGRSTGDQRSRCGHASKISRKYHIF